MRLENLRNADRRGWPQMAAGVSEKVYENALALEIRKRGLEVQQQYSVRVLYDEAVIGTYSADLLVESKVLVELKAQRALDDIHRLQCTHYLRATGLRVCLLMNFGRPRMEFHRIVNGF